MVKLVKGLKIDTEKYKKVGMGPENKKMQTTQKSFDVTEKI